MEEKGMQEKVNEMYEMQKELVELKKPKKFKLPLMTRIFKGKTRKKNFAIVQTIKTNGAVSFKIMKIEDDTITIGDTIHDASSQHVLRYKKLPLIIIPEWNMKPVSPEEKTELKPFSAGENFKQASKEGTLTAAQKLILTKMKMEAVKGKMNLNWKIILIILAIGAGALYLLDYMKVL